MREVYTRGASPDSRHIREEVFIKEQGFKEEFDFLDDSVDTLVIYENDKPIATGRMYEIEAHIYKLGRIAVIREYRHLHLGSRVIASMEERAKRQGATTCLISAQTRAVPFYNKCGYTSYGDTYYEEHVEHIMMKKSLN